MEFRELSGNLNNGQIIVNAQDKQTVRLILNGVTILSDDSAPIFVQEASKTVITLAKGTDNTLTDDEEYVLASGTDEPYAAIFSKDDLTINGTGSLNVNENYKDGIASKDELKIVSGNNDEDASKGFVYIEGGKISIIAGADGIQGETKVLVKNGISI
ncbi:MAG: carbohydrate-binding domain-containing protein [Eubacteriales bacterium]